MANLAPLLHHHGGELPALSFGLFIVASCGLGFMHVRTGARKLHHSHTASREKKQWRTTPSASRYAARF